jgi:hypothetical protein
LQQTSFRFKGTGNYPVDLRRAGSSTTVLGYRLRLNGGSVCFDLGDKALLKLSLALNRAHELPDPLAVAESVVRGWVEEHGPAFESHGVQGYLREVLQVLAASGFHEVGSISRFISWADRAVAHWRQAKRVSVDRLLPSILLLRAPRRSSCP